MPKSNEIICPACGKESLLLRQPVYEGFTKTGESLSCASCGHLFESEDAVPWKDAPDLQLFTDDDRPEEVQVFEEGEGDRLCRHCASYVVNPFTQWCGVHKKEVQATDTCDRFTPRKDKPEEPTF